MRRPALVGSAVIALALLVLYAPTGDPDVWWHLRAGELTLQHIPLDADPFSYSYAGAPWRYRDVIADAILYRGFAALSFRWFVLLKLAVIGAELLALAAFVPRGARSATVLLAGAGLFLAAVPLVERPNLFTIACFPLFVMLLDRARAGCMRPLMTSVLLAWVWMCLHRGGVLALPLLAALAGFMFVTRVAPSRFAAVLGPRPAWRDLLMMVAAALAATALSLATPFGKELLRGSVGVAGSAALRTGISEWQRLGPRALFATFPRALLLAATALVACVVGMARAVRTIDAWHLLLVVGFSLASFDSVRWLPYLATVSILVLARATAGAFANLRARPLPLLVWSVAAAWLLHAHTTPFTLGEDRVRLPVFASAFLERAAIEGPIANAFDHGGYLIWRSWPRVRVLVDGRNETVYPPAFLSRAIAAERDPAIFDQMRAEDGATVVIADNTPSRMSHAFLAEHAGWSLVFWSEAATIFVRDDAHPELAPLRYTLLDPRSLDGSVVHVMNRAQGDPMIVPRLAAELERALAADPDAVRPLIALAVFHHLRGDVAARDAVLRRLSVIAPDHPAVRELFRRLRS